MGLLCSLFGHNFGEWEQKGAKNTRTEFNRSDREVVEKEVYEITYKYRECSRCGESRNKEEKEFQEVKEVKSGDISQSTGVGSDIEANRDESLEAHQNAGSREPPVEIGDVVKGGVEEFSEHYTGRRDAVIRHQGFVIFVKDVPNYVRHLDVIRAKVTSFNKNYTSASARLVGHQE